MNLSKLISQTLKLVEVTREVKFTHTKGIFLFAKQAEHFLQLAKNPKMKVLCETGYNVGHLDALFLVSNPEVRVFSFDYMNKTHQNLTVKYLQAAFSGTQEKAALLIKDRLEVYAGDSVETVEKFVQENKNRLKCDLLHISADGEIELIKLLRFIHWLYGSNI